MAPFWAVWVSASGASAVEGPIGEDAVRTLRQTLYRLQRAAGSAFLKVGPQTYLGGSDFPATLLPVWRITLRGGSTAANVDASSVFLKHHPTARKRRPCIFQVLEVS